MTKLIRARISAQTGALLKQVFSECFPAVLGPLRGLHYFGLGKPTPQALVTLAPAIILGGEKP